MFGKLRKSSSRVSLVLIGLTALTGCGNGEDDVRKDVYKTREDCLADWANKPGDCKPASDPHHAASGFWYGPSYGYRSFGSGSSWTSTGRGGRALGNVSSGVSRGGFGASGHSSSG
jgi:uncharacterized protein YgiB involved in biofilm formation